MKKILITLLLTIFSFALIAQERELSDYEKYRMEKEAEMLGEVIVPDTIHDTVYVVLDTPVESETVVINNYNDYTQPNYRFLLTFGYDWRPYYQPYYGYYDPFFYDPYYYGGYYGYNYWYPYGSHYYPYYGLNYHYSGYYGYHNYGYYKPSGHRYATSSALGWNKSYYRPYNKTYRSGYVSAPTASKKNTVATRPTQTKQVATTRTNGSRGYTPSYSKPRTAPRSEYNGSMTRTKTTSVQPQSRSVQQRSTAVRTQSSTRPSTYARPSSSTRPTTYQRSSTPSRSYSAPSRAPSTAPSRSYSTPSRSSSSYSAPRSSSSSSRSYSSGSAGRSSSGGKK